MNMVLRLTAAPAGGRSLAVTSVGPPPTIMVLFLFEAEEEHSDICWGETRSVGKY